MSEVERRDVLRYAVSVGLVPQHPPLLLLAHFVGDGHLKQILCRAPIKHGAVHVGCGSTAVIRRRACYLRFAPNNGRTRDIGQCREGPADISVKIDMSAPNSAADTTKLNELASSSELQVNVCPSITGRTD